MSFLGSLFGGQNKTLSSDMSNVGTNAGFASTLGMNDASQASNFNSAILSGDQSKIGQVLAPQIGAIQDQKQQQVNATGEFGTRSGGNNAAMQMVNDQAHAHINDLISSLTGSAVQGQSAMGQNLLAQGTAGYNTQANMSQEQVQNYMHSIIGEGLSAGIGGVEGFGIGKL